MSSKETSLGIWDDFDEILSAGDTESIGFYFDDGNTPRTNITRMVFNMEQNITRQDEEWGEVYQNDTEGLRRWKLRLKIFYLAMHRALQILKSEETFEWEDVANCLSLMNAFRVASEQALAIISERTEKSQNTI